MAKRGGVSPVAPEKVAELHRRYLEGEHIAELLKETPLAATASLTRLFQRLGLPPKAKEALTLEMAQALHAQYLAGGDLCELLKETPLTSVSSLRRCFQRYGLVKKPIAQVMEERKPKVIATNMERYGAESWTKTAAGSAKIKEHWKTRDVKSLSAKRKHTNLKRHGVENPSQLETVKAQKKETFAASGKTYPEVVEKRKQTTLKKRGVEHSTQDPEVIEKSKATRFKRRLDVFLPLMGKQGYELLEKYEGKFHTVKRQHLGYRQYAVRHKDCGRIFTDDLYLMPRCLECFPLHVSMPAIALASEIKSWGEKVQENRWDIIRNPETDKALELDIVLPDRNIAIEYNSLYHHAGKKTHALKTDLALAQGFALYHVWDYQDPAKVIARLKGVLGLTKAVAARKTKFRPIATKQANAFFIEHHLQNGVNASFAYGLFFQEELVAAISFRQPLDHRSRAEGLEIARFCNHSDLRVTGGFSKLLKNAIVELKAITHGLITFADRDYCPDYKNSVYYKAGFRFVGDSGPTLAFYELKTHKLHSRQKMKKHLLEEKYPEAYKEAAALALTSGKEPTAEDILSLAGIKPIWNSGNFKFHLDLTKL